MLALKRSVTQSCSEGYETSWDSAGRRSSPPLRPTLAQPQRQREASCCSTWACGKVSDQLGGFLSCRDNQLRTGEHKRQGCISLCSTLGAGSRSSEGISGHIQGALFPRQHQGATAPNPRAGSAWISAAIQAVSQIPPLVQFCTDAGLPAWRSLQLRISSDPGDCPGSAGSCSFPEMCWNAPHHPPVCGGRCRPPGPCFAPRPKQSGSPLQCGPALPGCGPAEPLPHR